jgi:hypothetical protein
MLTSPTYPWRARVGPEAIALVLSIVVIGAVAVVAFGPVLGSLTGSGTRERAPSVAPASPSIAGPGAGLPPAAVVERGVSLNARLVAGGDELDRLLAIERVPVAEIVDELRIANQNLGNASAWTAELAAAPAGRDVAERLAAAYAALGKRIDSAFDRALSDRKGYLSDAAEISAQLRALETFSAELESLLS